MSIAYRVRKFYQYLILDITVLWQYVSGVELFPNMWEAVGCELSPITTYLKSISTVGWWCMHWIPAIGRQKQMSLCEFEASLVYSTGSWTAKATQWNPGGGGWERKKKGRERKKKYFNLIFCLSPWDWSKWIRNVELAVRKAQPPFCECLTSTLSTRI